MDATTRNICRMLDAEDPELRAAAARVLGELGPTEAAALAALSKALSQDVGPPRLYAFAALAKSPSPDAIPYILPALAAARELRRPAIEAIASFGAKAVPRLKGAALGKDRSLAKGAASALALVGGKAAHDLLLRALAQDDADLCKHICFVLDRAIDPMTARQKALLLRQVSNLVGQKRMHKKPHALAAAIVVLELLEAPEARKTLLGFATPSWPAAIRCRALHALRPIAAALTAAQTNTLVRYLDDDDLANVVLPTIEVLRPLTLPPAAAKAIVGLAHSEHPPVRDFAVFKMGRVDTPRAAKILIEDLESPDAELRRLAVASLRRNPAALSLIVPRLKKEPDTQRLWTLARILEPHASRLTAAQRRPIAKLLLDCLERDDPRAEPLAHVLRHADPESLDAALLKRARALKTKKRFAEADRLLRTLLRGGGASPEARFQAAVVALKLSPKRLGRSDRQADPALPLLDRLLETEAFDLPKRLKADRALEPADLFYVGFHFAEQLRHRRAFGGALLQHLVARHTRSAVATAARNKLRLEAFPTPKPKRSGKAASSRKPAR